MTRRVSALSEVLKETQAAAPKQNENILPQNRNTEIAENAISEKPQNRNTEIVENAISEKPQNRKRTKTGERTKLTFYLDPEDTRKFDTMRYTYNMRHGLRLDQNKFMRLIIKHLDLSLLEE
jgi:hypothetical protein